MRADVLFNAGATRMAFDDCPDPVGIYAVAKSVDDQIPVIGALYQSRPHPFYKGCNHPAYPTADRNHPLFVPLAVDVYIAYLTILDNKVVVDFELVSQVDQPF
jgi:hypothetical protein